MNRQGKAHEGIEERKNAIRMEQNVQERNVSWLYGIVLRDCAKQVVLLTKAKSVPTNMREFFSLGHKDITVST